MTKKELKELWIDDVLTRYAFNNPRGAQFECHPTEVGDPPINVWRLGDVVIESKTWWPWLMELKDFGLVVDKEFGDNIWWRAASPHEIIEHKMKTRG